MEDKNTILLDQRQFKDPSKRDLQLRYDFGNIDRSITPKDVASAFTYGLILGLSLVAIGFAVAWLISIARLRSSTT